MTQEIKIICLFEIVRIFKNYITSYALEKGLTGYENNNNILSVISQSEARGQCTISRCNLYIKGKVTVSNKHSTSK